MWCFFFIFVGASNDFDGATRIAKMMVTKFGMSDKVIYALDLTFMAMFTLVQNVYALQHPLAIA